MSDQPWYKDGLQFKCSQCGDCCTGAPGYIWVNKAEIAALAARLKLEVADFEKKYVRQVGIRKTLKETLPHYDCIFFDPTARKCTVYEDRPRQCRTWPFWDSNVRNEQTWAQTCEVCPGSGQGRLYQLEEIEAQRKVMSV